MKERYADDVRSLDVDAIIRELVAATGNWILEHDAGAGDVTRAFEERLEELGIVHLRHGPDCRRAEFDGDCATATCRWEVGGEATIVPIDIERRLAHLEHAFARANDEIARLQKYETVVQKVVEHLPDGAEAIPMRYEGCGFMFDYDDETQTHHLFVARDDRSVTLDVKHVVDPVRQVHCDEGSITCAIHVPSLRRRPDGQPSEDVYEHVVTDVVEEDLIEALRWLVGDGEMPSRARAVSSDTQEESS